MKFGHCYTKEGLHDVYRKSCLGALVAGRYHYLYESACDEGRFG